MAGIVLVASGVVILHLPRFAWAAASASLQALRFSGHARYAVLTGLLTATYSTVDKWNMNAGIPPLTYAYLTIPVAALLLTPFALAPPTRAMAEWRTYIAPARELGVVFGAALGSLVLHEPYARASDSRAPC